MSRKTIPRTSESARHSYRMGIGGSFKGSVKRHTTEGESYMATRPLERTLQTDIAGKQVTFDYSETWVGWSILGLRLVMGYIILSSGLEKLADGGWTDPGHWGSEFFLRNVVDEANPIRGMFLFFADHAWIVDPMVMWGQILIGLALLLGVFIRLACLAGALQMLFFWAAAWQGGILEGLPVAHGYVIDSSFVYALVLFGLGAWGAGRILGIDAWLEETTIVQQNRWLMYLLG